MWFCCAQPWAYGCFRIPYMNLRYFTGIHIFIYIMDMFPYPLHESTIFYWYTYTYIYHGHVSVSLTWIYDILLVYIYLYISWTCFCIPYMNLRYFTGIHIFIYIMDIFPYPIHESTIFYWYPFVYIYHGHVSVSLTWIYNILLVSIDLYISWTCFRIPYMNLRYFTGIHIFIYIMDLFPYPIHESTMFYWYPYTYMYQSVSTTWICDIQVVDTDWYPFIQRY